MNLLDQLLDKLAPHECLGCGVESTLLCPACANRLAPALERCYRCHSLASGAVACAACRQSSRLHSLRAATLQMAALMQAVLRPTAEAIVIPVPTATTRVRLRGYDQAELLARELARQTDCHYLAGLARLTQTQQHGAHRAQRLQQLSSAFRVTRPQLVRGRNVLLIDDVVTTGATLEAAAAALKTAGAARIDALVFAQAT